MTNDDKQNILGSAGEYGSMQSLESTQSDQHEYKVYKRRWYVLGVFVLTSCTQVSFTGLETMGNKTEYVAIKLTEKELSFNIFRCLASLLLFNMICSNLCKINV